MAPAPPEGFVRDLRGYDPSLRVRFAQHQAVWFIERKIPGQRNPQFLRERPSPWGSPRGLDLWAGWIEGYVHVLSVSRELLTWSLVAPELARCDAQRAGGFEALSRELDEAEAAWQDEVDRTRRNFLESASRAAHDDLAWADGRRIAVPERVTTDGAA